MHRFYYDEFDDNTTSFDSFKRYTIVWYVELLGYFRNKQDNNQLSLISQQRSILLSFELNTILI